jgi:hypothetical protein
MLRCASSLVIAAYAEVRLIPQNSRALPAAFLRGRPIFTTFKTFFEVVKIDPFLFDDQWPLQHLGMNSADIFYNEPFQP